MIGLYIGRFQPFHRGHLMVVKNALKEVKSIIIVPTVPLKAGENDPFSAENRAAMIKAALDREGINNYEIVIIKDIPSDADYVNHVKRQVKPFNVVFVGENRLNGMLFSDAGYKIGISKRFLDISSTEVRKRMREGGNWKELVPEGVADYIKKHELVKKVQGPRKL
ncbi:MAG: adenylyltransferase/cytidyltransferase family protein [Candidatus Woesearchaeota archaeon]|nr:adenylyltransferase/cytidyltransferase family protein [Candidatus Woesearchaeota archaeon]